MKFAQLNELWSQIVDTMNDGLVLIGPDGKILLVNDALARMTGYAKDELLGQSCEIFRCDACQLIRQSSPGHWCSLFENPDHPKRRNRCDIFCKDGSILSVLKNAAVLRDQNGRIVGAVETLTDISEMQKLDHKIQELSRLMGSPEGFHGMIGRSPAMERVFSLIEKAARSEAPVIIFGESGTGKELAARSIHDLSEFKKGPFVQLNCAALNEALLESELFGHVKGAFTGAYRHRPGRFEAADGGSLFLDEIGEMPSSTQVKLLRVLETKTIERVGDHRPIPVSVRIISATNRDLAQLVAQKRFREDLFFRINVIPIYLPPLRERVEDIPLLVEAMIRELAGRTGKAITGISPQVLAFFMDYPWPGNVRELRSALEFAFVVAEAGLIDSAHLPEHLFRDHPVSPAANAAAGNEASEKQALIAALEQAGGNKSRAARILGVSRATVWNRMHKYAITLEKTVRP